MYVCYALGKSDSAPGVTVQAFPQLDLRVHTRLVHVYLYLNARYYKKAVAKIIIDIGNIGKPLKLMWRNRAAKCKGYSQGLCVCNVFALVDTI